MLDLPPPYTEIAAARPEGVFDAALSAAPSHGAGTLLWAASAQTLAIAVVLEPAETLATARLALFAGLNAAGDALAAAAPTEKKLEFVWPDRIHFDLGLVGGARLAWPPGCTPDAVPDWLVFGLTLRLSAVGEPPPASLLGDGFEDFEPAGFVESFARHLMALLDDWHTKGPAAQLDRWAERAAAPPPPSPDLAGLLSQPDWLDAGGAMRP